MEHIEYPCSDNKNTDARALVVLFCTVRLAVLGYHEENIVAKAYQEARRAKPGSGVTVVDVICGKYKDYFFPPHMSLSGHAKLQQVFKNHVLGDRNNGDIAWDRLL